MNHFFVKKITSFFFACVTFGAVWGQGVWTKTEAPRFRNINSVWLRNAGNIVAAGGWLTNDSVSGIYTSKDSGKTWDIIEDNLGGQLNDICFTSATKGYVCGKSGRFLTTTNGGANWTSADVSAFKNAEFFSLIFSGSDSCWMVGGGIGTARTLVLFSADQGKNWQVQLDSNKGALYSVTITQGGNLWAAGYQGLLYFSSDKGQTWQKKYPHKRALTSDLKCVQFSDAKNGFLSGGSHSGDSVQLILSTTDGGNSWVLRRDTIAPVLNAIYLFNNAEGYAAGNLGTLLKTADGGITWQKINLGGTINDSRDLKDVFFYNRYRGIAGGTGGKILNYSDKNAVLPKVKLNRIFYTTAGKLRFEGSVNPEGMTAVCTLHYGKDPDMKSNFSLGSFTGNNWQNFAPALTIPPGYYYAKVSAASDAGTAESQVLTFYAGKPEVPNFDFELWNEKIRENLVGWDVSALIKKYTFGNNSMGIDVHSDGRPDGPGALVYGTKTDNGIEGGIPFSGKPTAVNLACRYKITPGDSALMYLTLKNSSGNKIFHHIWQWTGVKMSDTVLNFPITLASADQADSIILAIASTNALGSKTDSSSHLFLDSIWFSATTANVPNAGFDQWNSDTTYSVQSWYDQPLGWNNVQSVFRSVHAHSGKYAAHLFSVPGSNNSPGMQTYSDVRQSQAKPSFSIGQRYTSLQGYIDFKPGKSGDTLWVRGMFYKNGLQFGWCQYPAAANTSGYVPFTIPISYASADIPDSATLQIYIHNPKTGFTPGAEAWVDQLSFENWADSASAGIRVPDKPELKIFPNPAADQVSIEFSGFGIKPEVTVYNACGIAQKVIFLNTRNSVLDVSTLKPGAYVVVVRDGSRVVSKQFLKAGN